MTPNNRHKDLVECSFQKSSWFMFMPYQMTKISKAESSHEFRLGKRSQIHKHFDKHDVNQNPGSLCVFEVFKLLMKNSKNPTE